MHDNTAVYSQTSARVTSDELQRLVEKAAIKDSPDGSFLVAWDDVMVRLTYLAEEEIEGHKLAFTEFVLAMNDGKEDGVLPLLDEIARVKNVLGCVIEPEFDAGNKAKGLLISLARSFEGSFLFSDNCVFSDVGDLWYGPDDQPAYLDIANALVRELDPRR